MKDKLLVIVLLFVGILFIIVGLIKNNEKCPEEKIIYRYVPKNFEEEQNEPVYPSDIFRTMFTQQSPWIRSVEALDGKKSESINSFFISQY